MIELGQKVIVRPVSFEPVRASLLRKEDRMRMEQEGNYDHLLMRGTVVYIHPRRRYYTVEFDVAGGTLRESFKLDDSTTIEEYLRKRAERQHTKKEVRYEV